MDQKRSVGAQDRDEFLRAARRALVTGRMEAELPLCVRERVLHQHLVLAPLYAWSPKGQRARCKVPRDHGSNYALLASITHEGMGPCLAVERATTHEVFETYIERMLRPALRTGQVVLMDNLSSHKGESGVREL